MHLLHSADDFSPALEIIRDAFEAEPGEEAITFVEQPGYAQLIWEEAHGGRLLSVHMAIPQGWLSDPFRVEDIRAIARNVASTVSAEIEHSLAHGDGGEPKRGLGMLGECVRIRGST